MVEQRQGETYEEANVDPNSSDAEDGSAASQESVDGGEDKIFGLPKRVILIGVVVIILLIIMFIVFTLYKKSNSVVDPSYSGGNSAETQVYDGSGTQLGRVFGIVEGSAILDMNDTIIGFISSEGSEVLYNSDGEEIARYSPDDYMLSDEGQDNQSYEGLPSSESPNQLIYDSDVYNNDDVDIPSTMIDDVGLDVQGGGTQTGEIDVEKELSASERNQLLRKYGYTGDEIELADKLGLSTQTLVKHARDVQDEATTESLIRMSNKSSKEFRTMQQNTMFCMSKITFELVDFDKPNAQQYNGEYVVNADYHKCPTYGHQLYVKLKIADNFYAFMTVEPRRWNKMPVDGNMIVHVEYAVTGNDHANMYITNIEEINTTEITVNPQDSAVSIDEILGDNDYYQGALDDLNNGDIMSNQKDSQW